MVIIFTIIDLLILYHCVEADWYYLYTHEMLCSIISRKKFKLSEQANMGTKKTVLITGATGYVGRRLVQRLLSGGAYDVRLFVRNKQKVQKTITHLVGIYEGDTFDIPALEISLQNVHTAFYLIHSMGKDRDFSQLDRQSAENFREACIRAGVERIVYLGGLGVKESASEHLLSRIETGEVLSAKADRIQTIWIRAGVIIGSGSASFEIIRNLCQKLPAMITPRWVRTLTQPVSIDDVLSYLQQSINLEYRQNLVVDIGTEPLNFQQMMLQTAKVMGLKRFLLPVPFLSPRLSSYWLIIFTPLPYTLARSLVEGLKSETLIQNDNARRFYPAIRPCSFEESVALAGKELEQNQVISRWCDSSGKQYCDIRDFDNPEGAILRDTRVVPLRPGLNPESLFETICSLGGNKGWFRYNILWRVRGVLDKMFGGCGLNRGRRSHRFLRIGDAIDFWKVADIHEGKRLLLYAQMKVPGKAWLEFDIQPEQLVQTAHFLPNGILGRLYWYVLVPIHYFVFSDLARAVVKASEKKNTM